MENQIIGHVVKILEEVTGQGNNGTWIKQEFVIETTSEYPKKVHFSTWGDKTRDVKNLIEGEQVTVSFNPESREFNERWYTELRAWRIQKDVSTPSGQAPNQAKPTYADPSIPQPPQGTAEQDDSLPF